MSPGRSWTRCASSRGRPRGQAPHVVQPGGQGPGHAPVPDGPAGRGGDPVAGDRRGGRAFRRPGPPAAHDRQPGRDPGTTVELASGRQARLGRRGRGGDRVPGVLRGPPPQRGRKRRPLRRRRPARPRPGSWRPSKRPSMLVICPSNPVVSIGPLLAVPGDRRRRGPPAGDDRGCLPHHRRQSPEGPG